MRLVVPDWPRGTPAVMTTVSPGLMAPSLRATSTARENIRSVESTSPDRKGCTPQETASCRRVDSLWHRATMGQAGRKREMTLAV